MNSRRVLVLLGCFGASSAGLANDPAKAAPALEAGEYLKSLNALVQSVQGVVAEWQVERTVAPAPGIAEQVKQHFAHSSPGAPPKALTPGDQRVVQKIADGQTFPMKFAIALRNIADFRSEVTYNYGLERPSKRVYYCERQGLVTTVLEASRSIELRSETAKCLSESARGCPALALVSLLPEFSEPAVTAESAAYLTIKLQMRKRGDAHALVTLSKPAFFLTSIEVFQGGKLLSSARAEDTPPALFPTALRYSEFDLATGKPKLEETWKLAKIERNVPAGSIQTGYALKPGYQVTDKTVSPPIKFLSDQLLKR